MLALLGMMLLPVLKTAALMVPGAGLVFGAAIEQTEVERYDLRRSTRPRRGAD